MVFESYGSAKRVRHAYGASLSWDCYQTSLLRAWVLKNTKPEEGLYIQEVQREKKRFRGGCTLMHLHELKTGLNTTTSKCKVFIKYITVISNACKDTLNRNFAVVVLYIIRIEADSSPVLGTGTARIQVALEPNANVSSLLERSNIF